ncbi:MAG: primosomal protein N' [Holophagaceae bacterium]|nr:primosomal protein N' [Holophagaceae bacterium]
MSTVPTRIELPRPIAPLTYLAPIGLAKGIRVLIKVRGGQTWGAVLGIDENPPEVKLKPIESVLDPFPLLPPGLLSLLDFAATYYGCGLAHLMALCIPNAVQADWGLVLPDGRRLSDLRDSGDWMALSEIGDSWHRGKIDLPTLLHRRNLRGAGLTEVRLTGAQHPLKITQTQAKVLNSLKSSGGVKLESDLLRETTVSNSVLAGLERHGLIERTKRVDLLSQKREDLLHRQVTLNEEQCKVMSSVDLCHFGTHMLFGVTGSGKTEIYLELAERVMTTGKRVLWLVPEIGLTPRLLARLEARFPGKVAVGHAGLNTTEKQADVVRLLMNSAQLFVGVRSAVLAPLRDIGLIVVDEEQESSYKSDEHPRINARDMAIKRAQIEDCPVVLGSATPSLESWYAATTGRYKLHRLTQRPAGSNLPMVQVVDLRECYRQARKRVLFSPILLHSMEDVLARGEQSMILLNRRGFENFWFCMACGRTLDCPNCDISLTYHKGAWRLRCHLCGHESVPPEICPNCSAQHLRGAGEGTEQVEDLLQNYFPGAKILRLDRDTTSRRGTLEAALLAAEHGEVDILVGTQMLAKGHTFPKLTLVGVLNADLGLRISDFRSAERTFHLLTQVAGRAGRVEKPGRVILQTYCPEHPAIVHAVAQNFEGFTESELPYRKAFSYPPFASLVLFRSEGDDVVSARKPLEELRHRLGEFPGIKILGPLSAPISRVKNRYWQQLIIKSQNRAELSRILQEISLERASLVQMDRDPMNFGV